MIRSWRALAAWAVVVPAMLAGSVASGQQPSAPPGGEEEATDSGATAPDDADAAASTEADDDAATDDGAPGDEAAGADDVADEDDPPAETPEAADPATDGEPGAPAPETGTPFADEQDDDLPKCRPRSSDAGAAGKEAPSKKTEADLAAEMAEAGERLEQDKAVERFAAAAADFEREVHILLGMEVGQRKHFLDRAYDKTLGEVEASERDRRADAIARFERFIEKYPDRPTHTPDAMFRLAELYYERSEIEYSDALGQYDIDRDHYERGKIPAEPQSPERDYGPSARLYRTLLHRFGAAYRYADAVYYLLGYVLVEMGEDEAGLVAWNDLAKRFPKSEYAPEIHLRIGENYFDYGEFAKAAEHYEAALRYPESKFYDKVLYKLAWTHFQMWDYDRAIQAFKQLIAWYDANRDRTGTLGSALREEAVEYLAKSLTEDDWDNDGEPDAERGVARALRYFQEQTPFETDILRIYADSLYELHDKDKYAEAVHVYKELLRRDALSASAPRYQRQIVKIYDLLRDIDNAAVERRRLAEMFAPGSPWAEANKDDERSIRDANRAVEVAMREAALWHHQRAQELKTEAMTTGDETLLPQAGTHYVKAAAAYAEYLSKYPNEAASYDISFYLAETLYYSNQFDRAALAYDRVARDEHHDKYREAAAWSAVKSYERILGDLVDRGLADARSLPGSDWEAPPVDSSNDGKPEIRRVTPEPIPEATQRWQAAAQFYIDADLWHDGSREAQSILAYQSAEIFYRYRQYPEARDRFEQVMACYGKEDVAAYAAANIINSYREENDFANLERWADLAQKMDLGNEEQQREIRQQIKVFKLGSQFRRAEALLEAKEYLEAAREFERLADQNQDASFADKAYFNAASAYKEVKYYDSASRLFEKLVTDPRYRNSSFAEESLFELAETYKLFFNYEQAITAHLTLFERYPDSKNRPYCLYQAALLQEDLAQYAQSAETYERYASVFNARPDAASGLYRAGELHEKLDRPNEQRRIWKAFVSRYEGVAGMGTLVIKAKLKQATLAKARGDGREAQRMWRQVIEDYIALGEQPGSPAAIAAAEAQFELVEIEHREYAAIQLKGSQKRVQADVERKKRVLADLEQAYALVLPYNALDWTIATSFRLGDMYREFAQALYAAPEPPGLDDEELDMFITMVEDFAMQYENVAIERLETTVEQSRRLKVTNEWARRALASINKYKPADYPLLREEKKRFVRDELYTVHPPEQEAPR